MKKVAHYPLLLLYTVCFYSVFALVTLLTALGLPKRKKRRDPKTCVLFLETMGPPSAGFRYRSDAWANELRKAGLTADVWMAMDYNKQLRLQQTHNGMLRLQLIYLFKRFVQGFRSARYDTVIVRREILLYNDYGNLFFEKWLRRVHNNLLLDVDDDISAAKREPRNVSKFGKLLLEHPQKFRSSLRYYHGVVAASDYLRALFLRWDPERDGHSVAVIPTCVDYHRHAQKDYGSLGDCIKIGWVGSGYNLVNLYLVYPALEQLATRFNFELVVICDDAPAQASFPVKHVSWSADREIENLLAIDVGIMPLLQTDVSKGKGGFKLIQYMGCGIVSVATALTINEDIVNDGENGFLVLREDDWLRVLTNVLDRKHDFQTIGRNASETVRRRFSFDAHRETYLQLVNAKVTKANADSPRQQTVK